MPLVQVVLQRVQLQLLLGLGLRVVVWLCGCVVVWFCDFVRTCVSGSVVHSVCVARVPSPG